MDIVTHYWYVSVGHLSRQQPLHGAELLGCTRGLIFGPYEVEDQTLDGDQFTKFYAIL